MLLYAKGLLHDDPAVPLPEGDPNEGLMHYVPGVNLIPNYAVQLVRLIQGDQRVHKAY